MEETQVQEAPKGDSADVEKNKTIAALSYLIFFLPMITDAKDSKFAMFHANQGLLVLIVAILGGLTSFILIGFVVSLAALVFFILGIMNALNGKMAPLPLIGGINLINK